MKKISLISLGCALCALCFFGFSKNNLISAKAENVSEQVEVASVKIQKTENGYITVDKENGNVGDIVIIKAYNDIFYKIGEIKANGNVLVESDTTRGEYSFALIAGENIVSGSFIVDENLLGNFSNIYNEVSQGNWKAIFSVENIITIVKWALDCGIIFAMARYFIKDKKLEKKISDDVSKTVQEIIPDQTKEAVLKSLNEIMTPIFANLTAQIGDLQQAMSIFAKCMALVQEGTPEAKLEILNALEGLKIGDQNCINETKKYLEELVARAEKTYKEALEKLNAIEQQANENIKVEENNEQENKIENKTQEKNEYDGTSI